MEESDIENALNVPTNRDADNAIPTFWGSAALGSFFSRRPARTESASQARTSAAVRDTPASTTGSPVP